MKFVHGNIAVIDGDTHISKWVEESGRLDHDQYALPTILSHIEAGATVIDVGAFIGDHTLAYLNKVGKDGHVYAFEPNNAAFDCLKHNCRGAVVFNVGLSDKEELLSYETNPNAGAGRITGTGTSKVQTICLDTLAIKAVSFIKIDVEGFELNVLRGALKTIQKFKPKMWIEINVGALKANNTTPQEIENFLAELGYTTQPFPEKGDQYDILCTTK
jgi:FkbM family methyltransferase